MLNIALTGFFSGLSLIIAIGAQNAYVLRLGLMRTYVGIAVFICALSDAILIIAGTAGMGALVSQNQVLLKVISLVGAAYLLFYGVSAFWRARKPNVRSEEHTSELQSH